MAEGQGFLWYPGTFSPLTLLLGSEADRAAGRRGCQAGGQAWTGDRAGLLAHRLGVREFCDHL